MIKLNINIDFKRKKEDVEKVSSIELTADYISFAVRVFYKDGLESQWRRTWARVQRKLDDAIDTKEGIIEFEEGEIDFIQKAVKEAKFPADLSKYVVILEDEIEEAKKIKK